MLSLVKNIMFKGLSKIVRFYEGYKVELLKKKVGIHKAVSILPDAFIDGKVQIGKGTYINAQCRIVSGENSQVVIGENCAIGRFFSCSSRTHALELPTAIDGVNSHQRMEKDITIRNGVWIGDHVTIKEGVVIGDYAIIGANSVVTRNVDDFEIVGGVPAKHIRFNKEHVLYSKKSKA